MKTIVLLLIFSISLSAQSKKINFFGTEFPMNDKCIVKETSVRYDKNTLAWLDAPPGMLRGTVVSLFKKAFKGKKVKEMKTEQLNVTLLKSNWKGKLIEYKKEGSDSIISFIQLYGTYKNEERLLILGYKTAKSEGFRIPTYFDFLVK